MATNPFILEEKFAVAQVNPDGRKYQRVSRIVCKSIESDTELSVDINSDVYPVTEGEKLTIGLATTLNLDGEPERDAYDHTVYHRETAMSAYDYVMHGKVYRCNSDEAAADAVTAFASFGGLLMKLHGKQPYLRDVHFNRSYYLLIKKSI
uniref:DNA-directed RNA polymerases I, II, and III subunit RPABC3 n=1 Tax=Neobodo designis TaxID=312471 RepID=A0A7S1M158_NEODS|mmetsp:Transcript_32328/g.100037  ORF Transcript_32328/g.100037 Transcript_32328/m.100037 type:complete len:150 (+) Transcript_32328:31-480(+)|eukprot:CAMPEP_0174851864 /NCGR_PEP_ID=MMETSP1114-20130205/24246_1 /TAXON_ID=312471 /ORGANISM="Neobodo designis, Strain CCAP 1951/1" /LENGTH=149 /DNA_ID=CAMNT_0016086427 /DNA_START=31 /DNA_END=480 /DNA_ORIENTATION=+